jgi:phosphoribosylaminoimidazole-succinocarboxamide synthase
VEIKELLFDNVSEKIFATDKNDEIVIEFQDYEVGGDKKEEIKGRASANNAVSCSMFEYLESYNVPTHFVRKLDEKSYLAKRVEVIPMIVSIWNIASGELTKRFALEDGKVLEYPVVEMYLKNPDLNNPMISEYHAYALGLCDRKEIGNILKISTKINAVLKSYFDRKKMKLVNFQIEFGKLGHQMALCDGLGMDSLKVWTVDDDGNFHKFDKKGADKSQIYQDLRELIARD